MSVPSVLYEDDYCLAINKPNNMLVHHSHYARNLEESQSLVEWIRDSLHQEAHPVHRLDNKTSGVVLFCKQTNTVNDFQQLFEKQIIKKKYIALLRGHISDSGIIDSPVKNERGNYKEAETHYQLLKQYTVNIPVEPYPISRYSRVEFHQ